MMMIELILFFLMIFLIIYWYITKDYGFFKKMGVPESPGYFPLGSKWTWRVATGNGDAFKMLDDSEEPLNNEPFYGFYILGQRNLVVKE